MITYRSGDLLKDDAQALVNPVNCVGVMGKGLAKQFADRFPAMFQSYKGDCQEGDVRLGWMHVWNEDGTWIVNFPTKNHWRDKSHPKDIKVGLVDLVFFLSRKQVRSVALPALGCGNGGLPWQDVKPLIEEAAERLPNVSWRIYAPQ